MEFLIIFAVVGLIIFGFIAADKSAERKKEREETKARDQKKKAELDNAVLNHAAALEDIKNKPYTKVYKGPVFENISNATIINQSTVINSLNTINEKAPEIAQCLSKIAELIEKESNQKAADLFEQFTAEAGSTKPKKPVLEALWNGLTASLPALSGMVDIVTKVTKLFA